MMGIAWLKGVLFWFSLFITSLLGSVFILFPFVPLAYIAPSLWRTCADRFIGFWLAFPSSLCDHVFGVQFHVTGDMIDPDEPALIIMNHRTRLDWLFFWNALYKMNPWLLVTQKISLKMQLHCIPGAGWAMQCASFIFLERNLEKDSQILLDMISYYKNVDQKYQILLFPEGTDRGKRATLLSDAYAEKHGLSKYSFVLHPRTSGFVHIIRLMREKSYIKNVYDVTVGYSDRIVSTELELLKEGNFPGGVHFNIKRYDENELPSDDEKLGHWLRDVWLTKEALLKQFYGSTDCSARKFSKSETIWPVKAANVGYRCTLLFWTLFSLFWIYLTLFFNVVRLYMLIACAFFVFCQWKMGGFEQLAMRFVQPQLFKSNS